MTANCESISRPELPDVRFVDRALPGKPMRAWATTRAYALVRAAFLASLASDPSLRPSASPTFAHPRRYAAVNDRKSNFEFQNRPSFHGPRLQELGEITGVMGPDRIWSLINEIASKVRARHRPAPDKSNPRLTRELVDLGFELMKSAELLTGLGAAIACRDGLIIAFLAVDPLGRRNLADLPHASFPRTWLG